MIYAQIVNGLVVNVIFADPDFIGQSNLNYVLLSRGGIGWTYDKDRDAFIALKPYESWTLDESLEWVAPKPYPAVGGVYSWNEQLKEWTQTNV